MANDASRPLARWWMRLGLIAIALLAPMMLLLFSELSVRLLFHERRQAAREYLLARRNEAETILETSPKNSVQQVFRSHPYYAYTLQPEIDTSVFGWRIQSDRYGFRNRMDWDAEKKSPDEITIGLFGGSAAFGWMIDGNENTIAERLERELNHPGSPARYRVLNLALPAWRQPQLFILASRLGDRLDAIVILGGWNELFLSLSNVQEYESAAPIDFPWLGLMLPFQQDMKPDQDMIMMGLLMHERTYNPDGLLAKSDIYKILRHRISHGRRRHAMKTLQHRHRHESRVLWEDAEKQKAKADDDLVRESIDIHLKYSQLTDLLAQRYGIAVLHAIQPFLYADSSHPLSSRMISAYQFVLSSGNHPSEPYAMLRQAMQEAYADDSSAMGSRYVDMSFLLNKDLSNWLDLVHPSPSGTELIAQELARHITAMELMEKTGRRPLIQSYSINTQEIEEKR